MHTVSLFGRRKAVSPARPTFRMAPRGAAVKTGRRPPPTGGAPAVLMAASTGPGLIAGSVCRVVPPGHGSFRGRSMIAATWWPEVGAALSRTRSPVFTGPQEGDTQSPNLVQTSSRQGQRSAEAQPSRARRNSLCGGRQGVIKRAAVDPHAMQHNGEFASQRQLWPAVFRFAWRGPAPRLQMRCSRIAG